MEACPVLQSIYLVLKIKDNFHIFEDIRHSSGVNFVEHSWPRQLLEL